VKAQSGPHIPVLLKESLELLNVRPGNFVWIDATAGAGGHLKAIADRAGPDATIIGFDRDRSAISRLTSLKDDLPCRLHLRHANFSCLDEILEELGIATITGGIIADLGVSSMHLDAPERGFSFSQEGPLDMRMDQCSPTTAEDLINQLTEKDLADIIYRYGEEKASRKIAQRIVQLRPIKTTRQLAEIVARCVRRSPKDRSHPATRTFQALRIAVNDELNHIEKFLQKAINRLSPGARLAVLTFHSLEDRLVKQKFRQAAADCICPPGLPVCMCNHKSQLLIITRKPRLPESSEILANIRSRSAKLRACEKKA
jgi:16S rRNA (cytosine1402-N4)-methyltransferase